MLRANVPTDETDSGGDFGTRNRDSLSNDGGMKIDSLFFCQGRVYRLNV
jgi:hypothetical protein